MEQKQPWSSADLTDDLVADMRWLQHNDSDIYQLLSPAAFWVLSGMPEGPNPRYMYMHACFLCMYALLEERKVDYHYARPLAMVVFLLDITDADFEEHRNYVLGKIKEDEGKNLTEEDIVQIKQALISFKEFVEEVV